jgi:hypothetical protein
MNPRQIELALKRQRLQLAAAEQRLALDADIDALHQQLRPVLAVAQAVRSGAHYLRQHPQWVIGGALVVGIARPRFLLRWLRRALVAWQFARQVRRTLADLPTPLHSR